MTLSKIKFKLPSLVFMTLAILSSQDNPLPEFYHTYDDIEAQLNAWDEEFGSTPSGANGIIYKKKVIGYSTKDNLPFWGIKISDNADVDEDEPRILILGQCHAEEIYGVEISMAMINCFLNLSTGGLQECFNSEIASQVFSNLQNLEIWIVPTHNPEGLRVVHGYEDSSGDNSPWIQDVSYRKNKRDVNSDGFFSFDNTVEAGNDSDGVDLNRNFDLNWIFGDDKFVEDCAGSYCSHFDYYKGDAPFSETEIQAIRDFSIEKQFLLSIAYHSSRSGNVSEKVIYSWEWGSGTKYSPDFDVINDIGINISNLILRDATDGSTYTPTTSKSRKGNAHDWFYAETGTIQYLIEVGSANMQSSDSVKVSQIIEDNFMGAFYLLNRAWGNTNNSSLSADKFQITGIVTDGITGDPVHASVRILEMDGGVLNPRFTDNFGRYRRLLNEGNYSLSISAEGYENYEYSFYSSNASVHVHNVELTQLEMHSLALNIDAPENFTDSILLVRETSLNTDTLEISSADTSFQWYENNYRLTFLGDGLAPSIIDLQLFQDENHTISLSDKDIIFEEQFDNLDNWSGDPWWSAIDVLYSQTDLVYDGSLESIITSNQILQEDEDTQAVFEVNMKYEMEWDHDTLSLGLLNVNQNEIIWVKYWTDQNWSDHTEYVPLGLDAGTVYKPVIRLKSDQTVHYRGVEMESLILIKGSTVDVELEIDSVYPATFIVKQNYPNPFNAKTYFTFTLPVDTKINFKIYDLNGQLVGHVKENTFFDQGTHTIRFDANHLSSGIYFYSIQTKSQTIIKKMILLK